MEKKKKGAQKNTPAYKHLDLDTTNAVSSGDCTGLIPANPQSEEDLDAYQELYDYDGPDNDRP